MARRSRRGLARRRQRSSRRRGGLGGIAEELDVALHHVEAEVAAGDCEGAFAAALTAAGAVGYALKEGKEAAAAGAAKRLANATRGFIARCVVPR